MLCPKQCSKEQIRKAPEALRGNLLPLVTYLQVVRVAGEASAPGWPSAIESLLPPVKARAGERPPEASPALTTIPQTTTPVG